MDFFFFFLLSCHATSYLDEVEQFAPGRSCHGQILPRRLPHPVMGGVAALVSGRVLHCGGAEQRYVDCNSTETGLKT